MIQKWFVGVDGGGSKTAIAVSRGDCIPVAQMVDTGCSYQSLGIEKAVEIVCQGILTCLAKANVPLTECAACCIGMPCYGENPAHDETIRAQLQAALAPLPVYLTNDVEVGWAGASHCTAGIHLVAGTGSIAYGCDRDGHAIRSGGWNEFFGDEGSCYWLGREGMSLFTKEADGRLPRGPLYGIVRSAWQLQSDFAFVDKVLADIAPYRAKVAAFQRYLLQAAKAGDTAAIALYARAAKELALLAKATKTGLNFTEGEQVPVTYSGGLFHAEDFILKPLAQELQAMNGKLHAPRHSAVEGALLLAKRQMEKGVNEDVFD